MRTKQVQDKLMDTYDGHKLSKAEGLEIRIKALFANGFTSKSGMTLADTGVLKEVAKRLGITKVQLKKEGFL